MIKEKLFLGISLGFNSSACLYSNVRGLLKCVSQERFNRIKNTKEIPIYAIKFCIEGLSEIEDVCISHYEHITTQYFEKYLPNYDYKGETWEDYLRNMINDLGTSFKDIFRIPHHKAHQYSGFGFHPIEDEYYLVSSDGFGDGYSAQIYEEFKSGINIIDYYVSGRNLGQSIGLMYQFVTGALGFKEHEHEGKITGLAAHGKPIYLDNLCSLYDTSDESNIKYIGEITAEDKIQSKDSPIIDFDVFLSLKRNVYAIVTDLLESGAEPKDIASSVQEFAEKFTLKWLEKCCTTKKAVYLSGGLFANVKLNQRIKDSGLFTQVYVCPAMGDEGTCVGACIYHLGKPKIDGKFMNVFGGVTPLSLNQDNLNEDDLIDKMIDMIASNKVVCYVSDKMEFGPRALCHRTIFCDATDPSINDRLNKRLGRTEFMPFAPVCAEEFANDLFKNFNGGEITSKFMTITFDGTDEFCNTYKGVCHIDGTARPQCVNKHEMPFTHKLLMKYYEKTGKKCLINTSYNLHGEPIIDSTENAIKSFNKGKLDMLVINNSIYKEV